MGKVKAKKVKKKLKASKATAASLLSVIKKAKAGSSKQSSGAGGNGRLPDSDAGLYGVVPSEYNIQAQIEWLTAPPASLSEKKNTNQPTLPLTKKPLRGFHRDVCEACNEGECLMYCDKCPSAYHAICDDPPLPPEDYETIGINWKCKKCRVLAERELEGTRIDNSGEHRSKSHGPVGKFFDQCLPHQQAQNPVEFKLSKEMPAYDYPFPGTSRHILKMVRPITKVVESVKGTVPRNPTAMCFHCKRSCRVGALIQCDKCDMFWHLDCLDPPLTTIPVTVWMCPLHVEPYLESTQLTSIALSERIKIWERTEKPIKAWEEKSLLKKLERKANRRHPMFRRQRAIPMSLQPEIPEMVVNSYQNAPEFDSERFGRLQILATTCEVERLKLEIEDGVNKYRNRWIEHYLPLGRSLVDHRAKTELLRSRNESKLEHVRSVLKTCEELEERKTCKTNEEKASNAAVSKNKSSETVDNMTNGIPAEPMPSTSAAAQLMLPESSKNLNASSTETSSSEKVKTESTEEMNDPPTIASVDTNGSNDINAEDEEIEKVKKWAWDEIKAAEADVEEDLKEVNELSKTVRRVGEMLLNFPLTDEYISSLASKNVMDDPINIPITASLLFNPENGFNSPPAEAELPLPPVFTPKPVGLHLEAWKGMSGKTLHKLAANQLRDLRRKRDIKKFNELKKVVHSIGPSSSAAKPKSIIKFYIENLAMCVEITKQSFWIGSGDSCDWKITDLIKCNRIDGKHAKVFYNVHESSWEILNYSPHGIYVNDTLFGFQSEEAHVATSTSTLEGMHELLEMNERAIDEYIRTHSAELYNIDLNPCFCKPYPTKALKNVFEGSVRLGIGHHLQIGCAKLIIQDY